MFEGTRKFISGGRCGDHGLGFGGHTSGAGGIPQGEAADLVVDTDFICVIVTFRTSLTRLVGWSGEKGLPRARHDPAFLRLIRGQREL